MNEYIFEIIDKSGRKIHLSKERWEHINLHRYMSSKLEDIKNTLVKPTLIIPQKFDDTMRNYYTYDKNKKRYLLVAVKYLNGKGYITTAFITKKIIKR
jgi:hypothetical protein